MAEHKPPGFEQQPLKADHQRTGQQLQPQQQPSGLEQQPAHMKAEPASSGTLPGCDSRQKERNRAGGDPQAPRVQTLQVWCCNALSSPCSSTKLVNICQGPPVELLSDQSVLLVVYEKRISENACCSRLLMQPGRYHYNITPSQHPDRKMYGVREILMCHVSCSK